MVDLLRNLIVTFRVVAGAVLGFCVFLLMPPALPTAMRGAFGWDAGVLIFFALTLYVIGAGEASVLRKRASQSDTHLWIILGVVVIAAGASFAALAFVLQKPEGATTTTLAGRITVAVTTLVLSWTLVHAMFAIRYAHYFYGDPEADGTPRGGLGFPGKGHPDFWDFMYYSFVVGMTCQVSDVQVLSKPMRRLTLAHGVLAFFFNAGVLALAVNILATAL
ncbi:MAG TPA: DUF1345 domain-containing protein [Stellaceae bacterium]|jgi:uncharacterized membrane protein|nr:DUF1345 domain-containing protein [Stellaceae bacterium]